jgi:uncharacterized protein (DUF1800 family)
MTTALTGAAAAGLLAARESQAATRSLPRTTDPALHAARRLSYGATPALVQHLRSVGLAAWLDEQLADSPDVAGALAALGGSTPPLPASLLVQAKPDVLTDLRAATFARAVWGERQLPELLVELFSNHLSIAADAPGVGALKLADDRDVVRANVLGTFSDMLAASVQSPAMLTYLSNRTSRRPRPNENYARELLELHTVGVRARYTPRDVRDAAKALTGLSVDDRGLFTYQAAWRVTGPVRVLGWSHPNTDAAKGLEVALSLVRYLATHPSTAHRVAEKLVRRFVSDTPPAGLVASAARVYLEQGTAIPPVVRHVVLSREFARSGDRKTQRPLEWAAFAARALGLQQAPAAHLHGDGLVGLLEKLGQAPFGWRQPDGYPDTAEAWATSASMLSRWNTAQQLVTSAVAGFQAFDVDAFVGTPLPTTVAALADRVTSRVLCRAPRGVLRSALVGSTGLAASAAIDQAAVRRLAPGMAALVLSSPEAQVR